MEEDEEERDKDAVPEEDILSQVGPFQVPQHHEIIPLSILGCDQQNLENFLSDFTWAGHRLAQGPTLVIWTQVELDKLT